MPIGDIFDTGRKPRTETLPFSPGETAVTQYQQQMLPQISDLLSQALSRTDPAAIPPRFPGGVAGPLGGTMGPPQRWAPPANIPLSTPSGTGYTRGPTGPAGVNLPIPPGAPMAPGQQGDQPRPQLGSLRFEEVSGRAPGPVQQPGPPQPLIFDPAAKVDPIYAEMNRQDLSSAESTRTFNSPEFKKWQRTTGSSPMMGGHSNNQAYLLAAYNLSGGAQAWQLTPEELASKNLKRDMIERDMRLGIGPIQGPPPGAPGPGMADAGVAPGPAAAGPIPPVPGVEGPPVLGRAPIAGLATQPQALRDLAASLFPTAMPTTPEAAIAAALPGIAGPLGRRFTEQTAPELQALMAGFGAARSGEGVRRAGELYRQQVSDPTAEAAARIGGEQAQANLRQQLARQQAQVGLLTPQDQQLAALLAQSLAIKPPEQTVMQMPGQQPGLGTQLVGLGLYNAFADKLAPGIGAAVKAAAAKGGAAFAAIIKALNLGKLWASHTEEFGDPGVFQPVEEYNLNPTWGEEGVTITTVGTEGAPPDYPVIGDADIIGGRIDPAEDFYGAPPELITQPEAEITGGGIDYPGPSETWWE